MILYDCKEKEQQKEREVERMELKFNKNGRLVTISTPSGVGIVYAPTKVEMRKKVTAMVTHMIEREISEK